MAEEQVSKSFWTSVMTFAMVVAATLYLQDRISKSNEAAIESAMKPLVDQFSEVKGKVKVLESQMRAEISARKAGHITQAKVIDFINEKYRTNFYKPSDFFEKPEDIKVEDLQ